ncbi:hypothetical protein CALVIDRAFT_595386 [Calocera viscosa TUFC12733]|uniref:Uncharacterized protein n=1 Tax=Calocera viscosa (strain TUFC12733) TaxID=1330018 RepID=A0A167R6G5_CALVF|nr:hypothetical protein CALVIDRAFT_595386 [Calocera viscosa TUFC12733]
MADSDIDALFEDDFEAFEDEDFDDFLARDLAQEVHEDLLEVPDLDENAPSRATTSSIGSPSPPGTFFGLHLPTPASSTSSATGSASSSTGGSRAGSVGGAGQGAHEPLAQNVGTTALPASPLAAAKAAPFGAYPVSMIGSMLPAPQGAWQAKPFTRPWPSLATTTSLEGSSGPRSPGFLASQKKIFGKAGLVAGLDPGTPFRPIGCSPQDAIDLTRPPYRPTKAGARASSAPATAPESRTALATLPPTLLQALSGLLTEPPTLPPDLHQLLDSFLHPSPNPFNFSLQPTVSELMTALQAYMPGLRGGVLSRASSPGESVASQRSGRPYPARGVDIRHIPRRPLRQQSVASVSSRASSTVPTSPDTPHPSIPTRNSIPPTSAARQTSRTKIRKLRELRSELEAQRDHIARIYTQAKVRLRDLQVEESVLENTKKKLKALETQRKEPPAQEQSLLAMETTPMDIDLTNLNAMLAWAGVDQPAADALFS